MSHNGQRIAARQSLVRIKPSLRLAGLFAAVSGALVVVGSRWVCVALSGAVAFVFVVSAAIEYANVSRLRRRAAPGALVVANWDAAARVGSANAIGAYVVDGEVMYGLIIQSGPHLIHVDIARDSLLEARRRIVERIAAQPGELASAFAEFLGKERSGSPSRRSELDALRIHALRFVLPDPNMAAVSFTEESGGDYYQCLFSDGRFTDLTESQ